MNVIGRSLRAPSSQEHLPVPRLSSLLSDRGRSRDNHRPKRGEAFAVLGKSWGLRKAPVPGLGSEGNDVLAGVTMLPRPSSRLSPSTPADMPADDTPEKQGTG